MSPVSVEVRVRIVSDGRIIWEQALALPHPLEEAHSEESQKPFGVEERVIPLSTSVVSPGLFLLAPA